MPESANVEPTVKVPALPNTVHRKPHANTIRPIANWIDKCCY